VTVNVTCRLNDFTIGGTTPGLEGSGLQLLNNGTDALTVIPNGAGTFAFATTMPEGASYNVTVAAQPSNPTQICTVANGGGTVPIGNVSNIIVTCVTQGFKVGGRVSRLRGFGLQLQNNGTDNLGIAGNGEFTFPTTVLSGAPYNVTIAQQPIFGRVCEVNNGSGVIGDSDVRNVQVVCDGD
jgi:hypothetical protein